MAGLDSIDHVVLVMLENRSFDHMLGFLYPKSDSFDGLGGTESNLDPEGNEAKVFKITPGKQNAYYYPLANPAEGFSATNEQLFGSATPPGSGQANNSGFVKSFEQELEHPAHPNDPKLVGAEPASIMGMYGALRDRDAKAPDVGSILTRTKPRTDDPLAKVKPPTAADPALEAGSPRRGVRHWID